MAEADRGDRPPELRAQFRQAALPRNTPSARRLQFRAIARRLLRALQRCPSSIASRRFLAAVPQAQDRQRALVQQLFARAGLLGREGLALPSPSITGSATLRPGCQGSARGKVREWFGRSGGPCTHLRDRRRNITLTTTPLITARQIHCISSNR